MTEPACEVRVKKTQLPRQDPCICSGQPVIAWRTRLFHLDEVPPGPGDLRKCQHAVLEIHLGPGASTLAGSAAALLKGPHGISQH
jgi:hypothetical protein